ncbi:MAG: glycosyltransferase [Planctomycetales bacterium]|nr:glycosyltransferase [Planctomycetales bacterium]
MSSRITTVTAVYNRSATIQSAVESVQRQSYTNREYITIDGMSSDGTSEIIQRFSCAITRSIREPDRGIYDALNKGIRAATGDIVGFLHADDMLADESVLERIADRFARGDCDAVYGDLVYVDAQEPGRVIRYWKSGDYSLNRFQWGWMPPHPTVYVRKEIYQQYGSYRTDLGTAADYECMVRLMVGHQIRVAYIPEIFVKMRVGGKSNASLKNRLSANRQDRQAWIENGLAPPRALRLTKPLSKIPQYFRSPPKGFQ